MATAGANRCSPLRYTRIHDAQVIALAGVVPETHIAITLTGGTYVRGLKIYFFVVIRISPFLPGVFLSDLITSMVEIWSGSSFLIAFTSVFFPSII